MKHLSLFPFFLVICFLNLLASCSTPPKTEEEFSNPNIVFILADDLGYGDLGFLGQQYIETPNLDHLAKEGMFFSNHYAGAPVCAPSRSAFITGLHTGHTPVRGNFEVQPEGQYPLPDTLQNLSKILKDAGYVTGAFGKWGLGFVGTSGDPIRQGFDQFFGYNCQRYAHRYYPAYLWDNQEKINLPGNGWTEKSTYAPDMIQEKTLAFIEENQNAPFFLFMPIVMPHAELAAPDDELMKKYRVKFGEEIPHIGGKGSDYGDDMVIPAYQSQAYPHATFAAMVERIDQYVGAVMDKLEELGLEENTIVIFTSDNGAHQEGGADPDFFDSNASFRGYKRDLYEGGIRVPLIVKWPGKVQAGSHSEHPSAFWDWLPTFAEITGSEVPEGIDGISFLPTLLGNENQSKHDFLYWEFHELGGRQAVLKDGWKLVKLNVKDPEKTQIELFNLNEDVSESTDLSGKFPERVKELEALINQAHQPNPVFRLFSSEGSDQ
ncbi:arylsulfatase [Algoriphagus sp. CAU 1675]|uniref:arylsulfatase n=1 Tax=Algoriphagus sp. CAU 1675 TaxID=3032597 RepID=UPI0023DB7BDC|nr:arylsulfatase [Algoriphagus sp. CAU 1675]MDF2159165.1 arylsulfatase [Algoriphagus sp. CAU 1675]